MSTGQFSETGTILDKILTKKIVEVGERKKYISMSEIVAYVEQINTEDPVRDFASALQQDTVSLIAEVKKASPSKGVLIEDFDPVRIARTYAENGASAISVLTDKPFFEGDLKYLFDVRQNVDLPVLCKDFIIDPYQIYGARAASADAVLLIVAVLTDVQLAELYETTRKVGVTALVEVHDETELERALKIGAQVIGINNRDLHTFDVDLRTTERLAKMVPDGIVLVAESGIKDIADVQLMGSYGAHAVLVGEALVTAEDMAMMTRKFSELARSI